MAGLIALMVAAHAHTFDPAVALVDERSDGWHLRWTAPPGDQRVPVLPCPDAPCPTPGPVGVRGPGEAIVRVRWRDGHTATGIAEEGRPFSPETPARRGSPWTVAAAVALAWRAPGRLVPFAGGLVAGQALPHAEPTAWLAASVVLAARDGLVAPGEPRILWPVVVGVVHGMALGGLALPALALVLAAAAHRIPGLPWVLGAVGAAGVLTEVLP